MRKVFAICVCSLVMGFGYFQIATSTGCSTSQQRTVVNSLFTTGQTVDAAYRSYLDAVIAGKVPTNDVPRISQQYQVFQNAFTLAVAASTLNKTAPPSPEMANAASQLLLSIDAAKVKRK